LRTTRTAIEKRIARAKKVLVAEEAVRHGGAAGLLGPASSGPPSALSAFNEGYHGASAEAAVRAELCREATRLTAMLLEHPLGATPAI